ncbi:metallophosphoesterase family protein [Rhabdothermincola salaria]|uniref:metallophosphoesterase family protein n=1 Tax=Rhabdothermincola salaria TaxID=2903142 RepID=UPI001E596B53|nr:metallophosphoesterase [Rhabdothermincola salaria]MCD9625418.1 metallophosphoesterase [Rhabdothermincola salaria]
MELTTVADDHAVVHDGLEVRVYDDLLPDTVYEYDGFVFRTLARPAGERLSTFATVNDVHFGETECGVMEGLEMGPTFRVADGEEPYPETMNRGAIHEIEQLAPHAVVVKGDLTSQGTEEEYHQFLEFYEEAFGEALVHVRGNHESYHGTDLAAVPTQRLDLPGVTVALLDTSTEGRAGGRVTGDQLTWLHDLAVEADRPILLMGHHHVWSPDSSTRADDYFGIDPDSSERLIEVVAAHRNIRGYFAGHSHRNRVRHISVSRDIPWVEVACVKDFPGAWAEYRVFEGGILQVFHRISTPEALLWTEKTRHMFGGMYFGYAFGELGDRCFAIPAVAPT